MMTARKPLRILAGAVAAALLLTLGLAFRADAEYLGREPERIVKLFQGGPDAPPAVAEGKRLASEGDWSGAENSFRRAAPESPEAAFGLAVAILQQGRIDEAIREIEKLGIVGEVFGGADDDRPGGPESEVTPPTNPSPRRYRYAEVLFRLRGEKELDFEELREALERVLAPNGSSAGGSFHDAFDVWLGLNPPEDELRDHLDRLEARTEPELRCQRAEVRLQLDEPERALAEDLAGLEPADPWLRARARRARARAYYQLSSDAAGQAVYVQMLDELDASTAELLYRDIAAMLAADERESYAETSLQEKADFFRTFWTQRHPVPSQTINPRIGEHYRRLAHGLQEYGLQSNGSGYFTDLETFKESSPELPYYDPEVLFDHGRASRYWLDHRGLVYLRHGEPEVQMHTLAGTEAPTITIAGGSGVIGPVLSCSTS